MFTLVGDPRYFPNGYLSYHRSVVVADIGAEDWLIDDIKTVGGLIFDTKKEAEARAKLENFPEPKPVIDHFPRARGKFSNRAKVGKQPVYIPDWSRWHIAQALRNLAENAEHDGMHMEEMVAHVLQAVEGASDSDVSEELTRLKNSGVLVIDKKMIVRGWEYAK